MVRPTPKTVAPTGDVGIDGFAVTKSDDTVFNPIVRAIYVGGAGALTVRTLSGTSLTFAAVPAGTIIPIRCDQVRSTNTDATNMVALY